MILSSYFGFFVLLMDPLADCYGFFLGLLEPSDILPERALGTQGTFHRFCLRDLQMELHEVPSV